MSTDAFADLRSRYPVLAQQAYLNAGTCGPLAWNTADVLADATTRAVVVGRGAAYFEVLHAAHSRLRAAYAAALGADAADVALTTSTTDGLARALAALRLQPGDEVVTSVDEHPGLFGPLAALRDLHGITIRAVALADVADAVGPATKAVACSHISWVTGERAPEDPLREIGRDIPVIYDGAQGLGAIPVDPASLGCAVYAGSGQKWLCGPIGLGALWVSPDWAHALRPFALGYTNLEAPADGLDARPWTDARRFDTVALSAEMASAGATATEQLAEIGWDAVHARATGLADLLEQTLRGGDYEVAPRDRTPLVSVEVADPTAMRTRLAAANVVVRDLPGHPYIRVSTGAWNTEDDLQRLLDVLTA